MQKVVRDGNVAVIYSSGFGAGWYTWNTGKKWMIFHPDLVALIESGKQGGELEAAAKDIAERISAELGEDSPYCGGGDGLKIKWVKEGEQFEITEYDGAESVNVISDTEYLTA